MGRNLFDFNIYQNGMDILVEELFSRDEKVHIISGNAEVLKYPIRSSELFTKFNDSSSIIIPDGISVYIPYKYRANPNIEKITGIDLMEKILSRCNDIEKSVYFLGAKEEILDLMLEQLKSKHPKLNIVGHHHGYIDINSCDEVLNSIKFSGAEILFVAMGAPMQENFIFNYMDELPCKVFMGVGGSFDVMSGFKARSPKWVSNIGLEWLFRITQDKSKIKRLGNNLIFTLKNLFSVNRRK